MLVNVIVSVGPTSNVQSSNVGYFSLLPELLPFAVTKPTAKKKLERCVPLYAPGEARPVWMSLSYIHINYNHMNQTSKF